MKKKMKVPGFKEKSALVPIIDENYIFDEETTTSILVGFKFNKKVLIQGLHGTGKSSHIEQVAARLNWPCLRINLDGHISRFDLLGKDSIVLKDNKQVTTFKEGLLPWAIQNPVALVLDEYDAGRPDVMFVIQRILEVEGKLTLLDQNKVITPHPFFRIFGTCNTLGLGDNTGLYSGTQNLNQGQLDRWNIFSTLNFIEPDIEKKIIEGKLGKNKSKISDKLTSMIRLANLIRQAFSSSDLSVTMSPRTCILWAENFIIFGNLEKAFKLTFLNKCEMNDKKIIIELYQRCFGKEIE
jgi:cobaltochelatase CobS